MSEYPDIRIYEYTNLYIFINVKTFRARVPGMVGCSRLLNDEATKAGVAEVKTHRAPHCLPRGLGPGFGLLGRLGFDEGVVR